ncbi:rnase g and e associated domain containing protein [Mycoplasmopsis bovirhinis]|uniref:DUF402 domain-containing protein n=1 Tax=Mycoplasmopsis bovirhinis TaxID=29553 RepID=UPI000C05A8E9|nr:DUF402 domain-containing protein [Mycoplasmopsis bovirhinis]ATO31079.1 rnase g and e associated domain containing protein [Mycoplasmopsis bovirhinis]
MSWDFHDIKVGQIVNVQAYKHNGFLYRQWTNAKLLFHNKRHLVLSLKGSRVIENIKGRKGWSYTDDALWFIPKDSFYNTIMMFRSGAKCYYINLASQPIYEDNTIKFIDYDLDIKHYPNKELQIVDKEEFEANAKKFNYSKIIKLTILNEIQNLIGLYNNDAYFFNDSIIDYYLDLMHQDKLLSDAKYHEYKQNKHQSYLEESQMFKMLRRFGKKPYHK